VKAKRRARWLQTQLRIWQVEDLWGMPRTSSFLNDDYDTNRDAMYAKYQACVKRCKQFVKGVVLWPIVFISTACFWAAVGLGAANNGFSGGKHGGGGWPSVFVGLGIPFGAVSLIGLINLSSHTWSYFHADK
jgi:hypothetical protein